ncbi:MAG: hypothetical protein K0R28_987 [Paenibacillus sp.]|jgi:hypothetical protein|nr:hypothetical protein [Paenibacillus sp.]
MEGKSGNIGGFNSPAVQLAVRLEGIMVTLRQTESKADSGKQADARRGRPPSGAALQSAHRSIGNRMVQRMIRQHSVFRAANTGHDTIRRQLTENQMDELEYTVNRYAESLGCSADIVNRALGILQKRHNSVDEARRDIDNAFSQAIFEIKGPSKEEDDNEGFAMVVEEPDSQQTTEVERQAPRPTPQTVSAPSINSSDQQYSQQNDSYPQQTSYFSTGSDYSNQQNAYASTSVSQQPHTGYPNGGNYGQSQFGYGSYYGQQQSGYGSYYGQQQSGYGSHYSQQQQGYGWYPQSALSTTSGQSQDYSASYGYGAYPQSYPTSVTQQSGYGFQQIEQIVNSVFPDRASNIMELLQWASTSPMIAGFKTWYNDMIQRANDEGMVKDMLYELLDVQREINANQDTGLVYHLDNDKQSTAKSFDYKATREKKYNGLAMSMQETAAKHEVTHVEQPVRSSEDLHAGVRHIAEKVLKEDKEPRKGYKIGGTIAMTSGVASGKTAQAVLQSLLKTLNSNPKSIENRVIYLDRIVIVDHNFSVQGTFTKNDKFKWTLE